MGMKQGRFSNEQIVRILRETDQDSVAVVAKRHGVSDATIYIWRKKFGQLDTDEVKRLKARKRTLPALRFNTANCW
jgi:putative transposase